MVKVRKMLVEKDVQIKSLKEKNEELIAKIKTHQSTMEQLEKDYKFTNKTNKAQIDELYQKNTDYKLKLIKIQKQLDDQNRKAKSPDTHEQALSELLS